MPTNKSNNTKFGQEGEDIAADFLVQKGYEILERNYKLGRSEVDIICRQENELVFVEVKTRKYDTIVYPEQAVNKTKQKTIRRVANYYLAKTKHNGSARFDIIAIVKGSKFEVVHIEDAFYFYDTI